MMIIAIIKNKTNIETPFSLFIVSAYRWNKYILNFVLKDIIVYYKHMIISLVN